jgi:hypothetical protein
MITYKKKKIKPKQKTKKQPNIPSNISCKKLAFASAVE